jgi:YggT family protein
VSREALPQLGRHWVVGVAAGGLAAGVAERYTSGIERMFRRSGYRFDAQEHAPLNNPGRQAARREREMAKFVIDLLSFISYLLTLYVYVLIAAAVMSWLIAFNIVNPRSPVVSMLGQFLYRVTEPVLRPIRNILPNLGGIDISPVIVILIIIFLQNVIIPNLQRSLIQ